MQAQAADAILSAEYNRGYADGQNAGIRAGGGQGSSVQFYPPPAAKADSEMSFSKFLVGLFLGLMLGLLLGLFLGLFISIKLGGA